MDKPRPTPENIKLLLSAPPAEPAGLPSHSTSIGKVLLTGLPKRISTDQNV